MLKVNVLSGEMPALCMTRLKKSVWGAVLGVYSMLSITTACPTLPRGPTTHSQQQILKTSPAWNTGILMLQFVNSYLKLKDMHTCFFVLTVPAVALPQQKTYK